VEGTKRAALWTTDNIKVDRQGMGKRILDFAQDRDRWQELGSFLMKFRFFRVRRITCLAGKMSIADITCNERPQGFEGGV
jgi:hypothetical protein